jgi:hypothetical protein
LIRSLATLASGMSRLRSTIVTETYLISILLKFVRYLRTVIEFHTSIAAVELSSPVASFHQVTQGKLSVQLELSSPPRGDTGSISRPSSKIRSLGVKSCSRKRRTVPQYFLHISCAVGAITVQHFSSRNPTNWVDVSTSSAACTAFLKEWDTDSQGQANSATEVLGDFQLQVQLTNICTAFGAACKRFRGLERI